MQVLGGQHEMRTGLYTDAQRKRRDSSPWTLVQGILAPLQFLVFLVSLCLVLRTLITGEGAGMPPATQVCGIVLSSQTGVPRGTLSRCA